MYAANGGYGPLESIVELANEAHKDLWVQVPAMATNDYVTQLAQLIHQRLDPALKVYVEYSNEDWNSSWQEYSRDLHGRPLQSARPAQQRPAPGRRAEQAASRTKVIGDIFKSVFAAMQPGSGPSWAGSVVGPVQPGPSLVS